MIPYIRESVICLREPAEAFNKLPLIPEPDLSEISISGELKNAGDVSSPNSGLKIFKIACIDDSPFILDEMEKILGNNSQYSLTKIEDPVKAAAMIFRLKPDLILMDITMPDINGYKLCRLFRSSEAFEMTPIIMVTGNKGSIDKARAKLVGSKLVQTVDAKSSKTINTISKQESSQQQQQVVGGKVVINAAQLLNKFVNTANAPEQLSQQLAAETGVTNIVVQRWQN